MRTVWITAGFTLLMLLVGACDSTPGVREEAKPPAFVPGSFSVAPDTIPVAHLDSVPPNSVILVEVPLHVAVRTSTPARMDSVKYVVQFPLRGVAFSQIEGVKGASGALQPRENGRYVLDTTATLFASLPGLYTVEVYGISDEGRLARQQLSGTIRLISGGGPPVVDSVQAPQTVELSEDGSKRITIRADVGDPQGLLNVGRVELQGPGGARYAMQDDGDRGSGSTDQRAGDGTYSVSYPVQASQPAGASTFTVRATDRSGHPSAPVVFEIMFEK